MSIFIDNILFSSYYSLCLLLEKKETKEGKMNLYIVEWSYFDFPRDKLSWEYFEAAFDEKAREHAIAFLKEKIISKSYGSKHIKRPRLMRIVALPTIDDIEMYENQESWWEFAHHFFMEEEKKTLFKQDSHGRYIPSSFKGKMK